MIDSVHEGDSFWLLIDSRLDDYSIFDSHLEDYSIIDPRLDCNSSLRWVVWAYGLRSIYS